jgi:presenilin-like A22 family membrane protease
MLTYAIIYGITYFQEESWSKKDVGLTIVTAMSIFCINFGISYVMYFFAEYEVYDTIS